jgi:hypothetical protein
MIMPIFISSILALMLIYSSPATAFASHGHGLFHWKKNMSRNQLQMSVPNGFDTLTSGLASIVRLPFGTIVSSPPTSKNVPSILALYDMEGNTDCRLVRERISELDLDVEIIIPAGDNSRAAKDSSYKYYVGEATTNIPRLVIDDESGERVYAGRDDVLGWLADEFGPRQPIVEENEEELKKKVVEFLVLLGEPLPSFLRFRRALDVAGCARSLETPRPSKPLVSFYYYYHTLFTTQGSAGKVLLTLACVHFTYRYYIHMKGTNFAGL